MPYGTLQYINVQAGVHINYIPLSPDTNWWQVIKQTKRHWSFNFCPSTALHSHYKLKHMPGTWSALTHYSLLSPVHQSKWPYNLIPSVEFNPQPHGCYTVTVTTDIQQPFILQIQTLLSTSVNIFSKTINTFIRTVRKAAWLMWRGPYTETPWRSRRFPPWL